MAILSKVGGFLLGIVKSRAFIIIASVGIILFLAKLYRDQAEEIDRLQENFMTEKLGHLQTLRVTKRELEQIIEKDITLISILQDSLDIKDNQIKNLKTVETFVKYKIKTVLKDTIIYKHDTVYTGRSFTYSDKWNKVNGLILQDTVDLDIQSSDSLYLIHHTFKKGSWFLPRWFSKTYVKTQVSNVNPNHSYKIVEDIEVLE